MKTNTLYLYAAEMSVGDMRGFLRQIGLAFDYHILECYDRVTFKKFDVELVTNESDLNRGRAFGDKCDIRWRRKGDIFVVALTVDEVLNDKTKKKFNRGALEVPYTENVPRSQFLLWGQYLDRVEVNGNPMHRWFEKRIPQPLFYPVDDESPYVGLKVVDYYDDEWQLIARRFIEPYNIPEGERKR